MTPDPRTIHEKNAIPGAEYAGPRCSVCQSRRTERTESGRKCSWCGHEGRLHVVHSGVEVR